jgi:hypothetical protein
MSNKLSKLFKKVYIRTMEDHTSKLYWFRQFNECKCNTWVSECHTLCYSEHNLLEYDNGDWKNSQLIMVTLCYILVIWGRCNLRRSRRTVIVLPVYKISSLKITPPKTPNSGQFSYSLPNIISFLFETRKLQKSCERSRLKNKNIN